MKINIKVPKKLKGKTITIKKSPRKIIKIPKKALT